MSRLIYELEYAQEAFGVSNYKIVGAWIDAESCEHHFFCTAVTLLPLKAKSLIKAFCDVDVAESPSVSVVFPNMNAQIMGAGHELLLSWASPTQCRKFWLIKSSWSMLIIRSLRLHPLKPRNALKMST